MAAAQVGILWPMPKKGQTRELSTRLRATVAKNVRSLMGEQTATALGESSGVGRRSVDRLLNETVATTLDTLEAVSNALGVPPDQLLVEGRTPRQESDKRAKFRQPYEKIFGPQHHPARRRGDTAHPKNGKFPRKVGR